jgi:hypothetical protein
MTATTYTIPEHRLGDFTASVDALARRADRLGVSRPVAEVVGEELRPVMNSNGTPRTVGGLKVLAKWIKVEVTSPVVTIPGWRFLGVVQHEIAGNILRVAPDGAARDLLAFRNTKPVCEHCNTMRDRRDTYLVESTAGGGIRQVGRTCLGDFTGRDCLAALQVVVDATMLPSFGMADEDVWPRTSLYYDTEQVLQLCAVSITTHGFVSSKKAFETSCQSTANVVEAALVGMRWVAETQPEVAYAVNSSANVPIKARRIAAGALNTARAIDAETANDYQHNVRVALAGETISLRSLPFAAAAVAGFIRDEAAELARMALSAGGHLGNVGDRFTSKKLTKKERESGAFHAPFGAKLLSKHITEGIYGVTTWVKLAADSGHAVTWKASDYVTIEEGSRVIVEGTVKEHAEWRGVPETHITRAKLTKVAA